MRGRKVSFRWWSTIRYLISTILWSFYGFFPKPEFKNIFDGDASYKIFIEKHVITEVKDFMLSVVVLFALHYVFSVARPLKGVYADQVVILAVILDIAIYL